jgi:hypothetical protein
MLTYVKESVFIFRNVWKTVTLTRNQYVLTSNTKVGPVWTIYRISMSEGRWKPWTKNPPGTSVPTIKTTEGYGFWGYRLGWEDHIFESVIPEILVPCVHLVWYQMWRYRLRWWWLTIISEPHNKHDWRKTVSRKTRVTHHTISTGVVNQLIQSVRLRNCFFLGKPWHTWVHVDMSQWGKGIPVNPTVGPKPDNKKLRRDGNAYNLSQHQQEECQTVIVIIMIR